MYAPRLALALLLVGIAPAEEPRELFDRYHRTVYFAVLEGLFEDGVATEDVDRILLRDPETKEYVHFVYGCPLCGPARDAFELYRVRPKWRYKLEPDTFGRGLADEARAALASGEFEVRFAAVQKLVERWVRRRLSLMRLTGPEKETWEHAFRDMRKLGMSQLRESAPGRRGAKGCAVCDGALGASVGK